MDALSKQLLLEQVDRPFHVAAYRLLVLTGARLDEVLSLKWSYVDLEKKMLFLPDSKTGKKEIILTNAALEVLKKVSRIEGNPYVIIGHKDGQHLVNLRKHWTELREKVGLNDVRLHDLRHSFASTAIAAGVPLATIGKLLGHKNSKTTERYAHLGENPLRAASELISRKIGMAKDAPADSAQ